MTIIIELLLLSLASIAFYILLANSRGIGDAPVALHNMAEWGFLLTSTLSLFAADFMLALKIARIAMETFA